MLTRIGGNSQVQLVRNNQPELLTGDDNSTLLPNPPAMEDSNFARDDATNGNASQGTKSQGLLDLLDSLTRREAAANTQPASESSTSHRYALREVAPLRFLTQELPLEVDDLLGCMEQQIPFNDRALLTALAKDVQIIRIEKSHLGALEEEQRSIISARIDLEKAERQAQQLLLRQQYLSPKDLQDHLLKRLAVEFRNHGLAEVAEDEERLEVALALILVRHPGLLREVEKSCSARFSYTRETEPLPGFMESPVPLPPAYKNIYGVYPSDLNPWEVEFAKMLDKKRRTAMTACYDPRIDKNVLDAVFRCTAMPTY
ncbi:MAG: hypothetical protein WCP45_01115 [Verrucomicrobiota bacterium]